MAKPGENMPKLGWKDQLLYWSLIIPNMVLSLGGIFISLLAQDMVAFSDRRVVASTVGEGNLNSFFLMLWCMIAFVVILAGFQQHRIPVFGRKDVTYGQPKYDDIYPLLSKDRPRKKLSPSQKTRRIIAAMLILVSFLFSAAMFPRSFYGRAVLLEDGTIEVYNASNELTHHYSTDEITEVRMNTYASGKYGGNWKAEMVVTAEDEEVFRYAAHSFAGDDLQQLQTMLTMKVQYGSLVTIQGTEALADVIQDQKYDMQEQALLYSLFRAAE